MTLRFGAVADLHMASHRLSGGAWRAGINERGYQTTGAFGNALSIAEAKKHQCVVALGDVFDTTSPEPQLIAETQRMINQNAVTLEIILGNHDMESAAAGDHAVGPLAGLRDVRVHERPTVLTLGEVGPLGDRKAVELWLVPFATGATSAWLPGALELLMKQSYKNAIRVLCVHFGIYDAAMLNGPGNNWILAADDAISSDVLGELCVQYDVPLVLAGNWHARRAMRYSAQGRDVLMVQVGTLCPTGWDNPGFEGYGGLACVEVDDLGIIDVDFADVPGPRFVTVRSDEELAMARVTAERRDCQLYVRWVASPNDVSHARQVLESATFGPDADVTAFRIDLDKSEAKAASQQASSAARSATTREEALEAFVSKMPLAEGLDRSRIFNLSKGYLNG